MKIKNIFYMASLLVSVGLQAAQPEGALVPLGAQQALRTQAAVLQELVSLNPVPVVKQDALHVVGVYGQHITQYPIAASAACLPLVMMSKGNLFYGIDNTVKWLVSAAVGAGVVAGLYYGPRSAKKQLTTEILAHQQLPHTQRMLQACADRTAGLENIHGEIVAQRRALLELAGNVQNAQQQLCDLQNAGQASTALAQIESIQTAVSRNVQLVQIISQITQSSTADARMRATLVQTAQNMIKASELCESARATVLVQVQGNNTFLNPENAQMIEVLRTDLASIFAEQANLRETAGRFLDAMQLQIQAEQQEQRRRLALQSAATAVHPSAAVQSQLATNSPLVLRNTYGFGLLGRVLSTPISAIKQPEPTDSVFIPVDDLEEVGTSGNEDSDVD